MTTHMIMAMPTTIMIINDVNRHDDSIRSFSILHDEPIDPVALYMFVDLLRSAHGDKLLRMKAIVKLADRSGAAAGAAWRAKHLSPAEAACQHGRQMTGARGWC